MRKLYVSTITLLSMITGSAIANETPMIGVVNFANCITESKSGKKEQENLENMRQQMATLEEDTEKELKEIAAKLEDPEYLDSLSPKAEDELKTKRQTLQEDLMRYRNQFYQVLNHAQYQMVHKLQGRIVKAAEAVASDKNLDYVLNKESCFYIRDDLDVTDSVISIMDQNFELEEKAASLNAGENMQLQEAQSEEKAG